MGDYMKKTFIIYIIVTLFFTLVACSKTTTSTTTSSSNILTSNSDIEFGASDKVTKVVNRIKEFKNLPDNYSYLDYEAMAKYADEVIFSFASDPYNPVQYYDRNDTSTWSKVGFFLEQNRIPSNYNPLVNGYLKRSFSLPTYLGDSRVFMSGSEPITYISMILGSTYAGIDKSNQTFGDYTYDFVEMTQSAYNTGSNLVQNVGTQGQSFWYDIFPQIVFTRLYDKYQSI